MEIREQRPWYEKNDHGSVLDGANISITREKTGLVDPDVPGKSGLSRVILGPAPLSGGAVMVVPEPNPLQHLADRPVALLHDGRDALGQVRRPAAVFAGEVLLGSSDPRTLKRDRCKGR